MTIFLRILDASVDDKPAALVRAITALHDGAKADEFLQPVVFEREPAAFAAVPGSPFAYWVSEAVRGVFGRFKRFEADGRSVKQGLATADDFRFARAWWEVSPIRMDERWFGFAKGGAFSPFYADVVLLVGYSEGDQVGLQAIGRYGRGATHYFRPGLTWPLRTNGLSFRAMPAGCIFGHKGPAAVVEDDSPNRLLALCAILNSRAFGYLVSVQLARTELAQSYEVGLIQQTPVPDLSAHDIATLTRLARCAWSLKRSLDTMNETSHAFLLPRGLNEKMTGLDRDAVERELVAIQREIDDHAFMLYGIGPEDRAVIEASSKRASATSSVEDNEEVDATDDDAAEDDAPVSAATDTLLSWLVGVAFGRFDPRLATGERAIPAEPEPFDPLLTRSPGMWPEGKEKGILLPDILVCDPGHNGDLRAHVADAAANIGWPDPQDLHQWLALEFFPLHIKMYSKSRRKAPIYWQLATPSSSYSVWLYIHAFTKDSLFRVQNDYVTPKLAHEERRFESMAREQREQATATQRKALAIQEAFVDELRAFLDEVKRVAPLWQPDLDDGVIINFAPLWRLVPQHKPWQKELKATWDALCDGKYDWAHLAMHLWPERVVPKCATDRSLAIAHGLEHVFWVEGSDGKWSARKTPSRPNDELVRERTSSAVKAALKSLLEAPVAAGGSKKTRKGKTHA